MSGLAIRPVEHADLPRVWELVLELAQYERLMPLVTGTPAALSRLLFDTPGGLEGLVAQWNERTVGYALFYPRYSSFRTRTRLWLEDLYVEPGARGTGAGRALLREVARAALERGGDRVDWDVLDWNQLAIDFYERQGGTRVIPEWLQFGMDEQGLKKLVEAGA